MIKAVGIKKYYGDVKAVDGVDILIEPGKIYSLLGPNGAGKTTTVEILIGLRTKDAGEIKYFDTYSSITKEVKERIGVCLQQDTLFDELTVLETLKLYRSLYKKGLQVTPVLEDFELSQKEKSYVKNLSGGQKRRLSVALAFINDPDLVFLDEPTTGLDPQARHSLWDVIKKFKKSGKSILLTTHYMEEAQQLSDYVYIMDYGKIIAKGTPEELITSSGLSSVVEFQAEDKSVLNRLENLGKVIVDGNSFEVITTDISSVVKILLENKIETFTVRTPTLEDVFLKLTGRHLRD